MLLILGLFATLENRLLGRLADEDRGGVVIEYGIVVAVIALGLIAVGTGLVNAVAGWFVLIGNRIAALPG